MNLLIDVGNTRVKYCYTNINTLTEVKTCQANDFISMLDAAVIKQILLVAVSNQPFCQQLLQWATMHNINCRQLHTEKTAFGITNSYDEHHKMGADRWLAVLGAESLFPNMNLLIVDSGTATTIDILDANKQHRGGWIIPGIDLMMNALFNSTDKVKGQAKQISTLGFGTNTCDSVNFGCWATTTAAVHGAMVMNNNNGLPIDKLILTGGNASELERLGSFQADVVDNLVFKGMQRFLSQ